MPVKHYIRHPVTPTELGTMVLRARFSLGETQEEFARRFHITTTTLSNWERGKTSKIQKIHRTILDSLVSRLRRDGIYIANEVMVPFYREVIERDGNATR